MHKIVIYDDRTEWFGDINANLVAVRLIPKDQQCEGYASTLYGYISLELEDDEANIESAYIVCNSEYAYHEAYNRCCSALIARNNVIDLRGLDAKLYES